MGKHQVDTPKIVSATLTVAKTVSGLAIIHNGLLTTLSEARQQPNNVICTSTICTQPKGHKGHWTKSYSSMCLCGPQDVTNSKHQMQTTTKTWIQTHCQKHLKTSLKTWSQPSHSKLLMRAPGYNTKFKHCSKVENMHVQEANGSSFGSKQM